MELLKKYYDMEEEDFLSAELEIYVLVRWIMEVEMVKGDNVTLTFDGVGIIITAKKVALKIQTQES